MRTKAPPSAARRSLNLVIVLVVLLGLVGARPARSQTAPPNVIPTVPSFDVTRSIYTSAEDIGAVAVGALDGNPAKDDLIATVNARGTVRIFVRNGAEWQSQPEYELFAEDQRDATGEATSIAIGQIFADGLPEIVVGVARGQSAILSLGLDAAPGLRKVGVTRRQLFGDVGPLTALAVADIDQTGADDIVLGYGSEANKLQNQVYFNGSTSDNPTRLTFPGDFNQTSSLAVGQIDGSSGSDVLVGNSGGASYVVRSAGGAGFVPERVEVNTDKQYNTSSVALMSVRSNPPTVALVLGNEPERDSPTLAVYQYVPPATPTDKPTFKALDTDDTNQKVISLITDDVDGDSYEDVIAAYEQQEPAVFIQRTEVESSESDLFLDPRALSSRRPPGDRAAVSALAAGLLDGDATIDLAAVGPGLVEVFYNPNRPTASLACSTLPDQNSPLSVSVAVADLSGDGRADIVQGTQGQQSCVHLSQGNGEFKPVPFGAANAPTVDVAAGRQEFSWPAQVVVANERGQSLVHPFTPSGDTIVPGTPGSFGVANDLINRVAIEPGQGAQLIAAGRASGPAQGYIRSAAGYEPLPLEAQGSADVVVANLVGSAAPEVVVGRSADGQVTVYQGLPYTATAVAGLSAIVPGLTSLAVGSAIFDTQPAIIAGSSQSTTVLFVQAGGFQSRVLDTTSRNVRDVAAGDLDGDQFPDVVTVGAGEAAAVYYSNPISVVKIV